MIVKKRTYRITDKDGNEVAYGTLEECGRTMGYSKSTLQTLMRNCRAGRNTRYHFERVGVENVDTNQPKEAEKGWECPCKSCIKGPTTWPKGLPSCACEEYCGTWKSWWRWYWRNLTERFGGKRKC